MLNLIKNTQLIQPDEQVEPLVFGMLKNQHVHLGYEMETKNNIVTHWNIAHPAT
jgi:hypothetical protein